MMLAHPSTILCLPEQESKSFPVYHLANFLLDLIA